VQETQTKKILLTALNQIEDAPILPAGGRAVAGSNPVSPMPQKPRSRGVFVWDVTGQEGLMRTVYVLSSGDAVRLRPSAATEDLLVCQCPVRDPYDTRVLPRTGQGSRLRRASSLRSPAVKGAASRLASLGPDGPLLTAVLLRAEFRLVGALGAHQAQDRAPARSPAATCTSCGRVIVTWPSRSSSQRALMIVTPMTCPSLS
jgi:hypothetical protein